MGKVLRPLNNVSKARRVADPLAQLAASGMLAEGLAGLGISNTGPANNYGVLNRYVGLRKPIQLPGIQTIINQYVRLGMSPVEARNAALKLIYANNLARKTL